MEKGKGKWVRITCAYSGAACLNETKKGGETSKSKILRILKRGIWGWPTCIKSRGDKIGMAWS